MARPASIASFDAAAAAEALDLFDDKNASFRTSKLAATGAVFGSSPRYRGLADAAKHGSATHPTRLLRRSTSEALARPTSSSIATPSRLRSSSAAQVQERPGSPDIDTILAKTPRPRRASSAVFSSPSRTSLRSEKLSHSSSSPKLDRKTTGEDDESIFSISDYGVLLEEDESQSEGGGGSESDSSIDIHTPLPHLMFRDGLLSPRSKLLPQDAKPSIYALGAGSADRSRSVMSVVSTVGSFVTKSGLQKDPRDTVRRRQRHRDGALLRAGMGLTTGLGWSDSEDEDAPSALTRRLITTTLDRKRSASVALSSPSRPTSSQYDDLGLSRFASPVPMSRFTSPVPSSKHILTRKSTGSFVGMRSMSVSQIQTRAATVSFPSTPTMAESKLPSTPEEESMTRKRTPSATSVSSKTKSPPSMSTGLPSSSSSRQRTSSSASSTQIPVPRSRAGSLASNIASAVGHGSRSRTGSSASTAPSQYSRHRTESSTSSAGHSIPAMPRPSLESLASESLSSISSSSDHTTSSVYSSSTASASSGSGPRPLRLVESISARSHSLDPIVNPSSSGAPMPPPVEGSSTVSKRPRALSGPRPRPQARSPTPTQSHIQTQPFGYDPPALQRNFTYPRSEEIPSPSSPPSATTSTSTVFYSPISTPPLTEMVSSTSTNSPSPSSPSSPRQRPTLIGARPKPRTGTGMAYRTSSFPNLQAQASALKLRTLATGPTPVSMAAEGGSGYPVRI